MNRCLRLLGLVFLLLQVTDTCADRMSITLETPGGLEQRVFLGWPQGLAQDRPIVFVMHGVRRNASEYRDQWYDLAVAYDFLLVVPEFSERNFPDSAGYNLGNVFDSRGQVRPQAAWSFSVIEPIFDELRNRHGLTAPGYAIYGHSAGAQFVHRYLFHVPEARITRAVAANAGWYTMPVFNVDYPYGLRGSVVDSGELTATLRLPFTVLLGEEDTDPEHPSLRRTPEAQAQGPHRFARGHAFFDAAMDTAARLGVPFTWQLATVPGSDHDNRLMAPAAILYLLQAMES